MHAYVRLDSCTRDRATSSESVDIRFVMKKGELVHPQRRVNTVLQSAVFTQAIGKRCRLGSWKKFGYEGDEQFAMQGETL